MHRVTVIQDHKHADRPQMRSFTLAKERTIFGRGQGLGADNDILMEHTEIDRGNRGAFVIVGEKVLLEIYPGNPHIAYMRPGPGAASPDMPYTLKDGDVAQYGGYLMTYHYGDIPSRSESDSKGFWARLFG